MLPRPSFAQIRSIWSSSSQKHSTRSAENCGGRLRAQPDPTYAKSFKGARWALLKNPDTLTETQEAQLKDLKRTGAAVWRADEMKEQFRAIFAGDLTRQEAGELLDR